MTAIKTTIFGSYFPTQTERRRKTVENSLSKDVAHAVVDYKGIVVDH